MKSVTTLSEDANHEKKRLARFISETNVEEGTFRHSSRVQVASIAMSYGLDVNQFVRFAADRFSHSTPGYITEWAERIADGRHWHVADAETRKALKEAGYAENR